MIASMDPANMPPKRDRMGDPVPNTYKLENSLDPNLQAIFGTQKHNKEDIPRYTPKTPNFFLV
jgi:hypothetical protein